MSDEPATGDAPVDPHEIPDVSSAEQPSALGLLMAGAWTGKESGAPCRLVVIEARRVLLGPTIRASVVIEDHCRYSFDLVVSETADSSSSSSDTVRFSSLLMLHPSLAPLVVLGQIRQGTVIEINAASLLTLSSPGSSSRTSVMIMQLRIGGFSVGAASVDAPTWLKNEVFWHPFTMQDGRPALSLRRMHLPCGAGDDAMSLVREWRGMSHPLGRATLLDLPPPPGKFAVEFVASEEPEKEEGEGGGGRRRPRRVAIVCLGSRGGQPPGRAARGGIDPPSLRETLLTEMGTSGGRPRGHRGTSAADLMVQAEGAEGPWAKVGGGTSVAAAAAAADDDDGGGAAPPERADGQQQRHTPATLRWAMQLPLVGRLESVGPLIHSGAPQREAYLPFWFEFFVGDAYGYSAKVVCWQTAAAKWHSALRSLPLGSMLVIHGYRVKVYNGSFDVSLNWANPASEVMLVQEGEGGSAGRWASEVERLAAKEAKAAEEAAAALAALAGGPVAPAPAPAPAPEAEAEEEHAPPPPASCALRSTPLPDLRFHSVVAARSLPHATPTSIAGIVARVGPVICSPLRRSPEAGQDGSLISRMEDDALIGATLCGGSRVHLQTFAAEPGCEVYGVRLRCRMRTAGLGRGPTQEAMAYSRWVWVRDDSSIQQLPVLLACNSRWEAFAGIRAGCAIVVTHCSVVSPLVGSLEHCSPDDRPAYVRSTQASCLTVGNPGALRIADEAPAVLWYARHCKAIRSVLHWRQAAADSDAWFRRTPSGMALDDEGGALVHRSTLSRPPTLGGYCELMGRLDSGGDGGGVREEPGVFGGLVTLADDSQSAPLLPTQLSVQELLWIVEGVPHATNALLVDSHLSGTLGHSDRRGTPIAAGLAFREDTGRVVVSPLAVGRVCCTLAPGQVIRVIVTGVISSIRRVYPEEEVQVPDPSVAQAEAARLAAEQQKREEEQQLQEQQKQQQQQQEKDAERSKPDAAAASAPTSVIATLEGRPDVPLGPPQRIAARVLAALRARYDPAARASRRGGRGGGGAGRGSRASHAGTDASSDGDGLGARSVGEEGDPPPGAAAAGPDAAAPITDKSPQAEPGHGSDGDGSSEEEGGGDSEEAAARRKRNRELSSLQPWWLPGSSRGREEQQQQHKQRRLLHHGSPPDAPARSGRAAGGASERPARGSPAELLVSDIDGSDAGGDGSSVAGGSAGALQAHSTAPAPPSGPDADAAEGQTTEPAAAAAEAGPLETDRGDEEEEEEADEDPMPPSSAAAQLARTLPPPPPPRPVHWTKRKGGAAAGPSSLPPEISQHRRWRAMPRHERQRQLAALAGEREEFEAEIARQRQQEQQQRQQRAGEETQAALAAATQPLVFDDEADAPAGSGGAAGAGAPGDESADAPVVPRVADVVQGLHEVLNEPDDDDGGDIAVPPESIEPPPGSRPLFILRLQDPPDKPGLYSSHGAGQGGAHEPAAIDILMHPSALLPHAPDLDSSVLPDGTTPDACLNLLRSFFPPTPASYDRSAFGDYATTGRRFAVCLTVHQRTVDVPDADVPSGLHLPRARLMDQFGPEAEASSDRRLPFVNRVSARRAIVRVEAIYEVAAGAPAP